MGLINQIVTELLNVKPYIMLPVIILLLSLAFRLSWKKSLISALTIGVGFIGIFTVFEFFITSISPAINALVQRMGLPMNAMDVGWPPLAAITWSFRLAPLFLVLGLLVNAALLIMGWTRTVNIDIWNYWHFIFTGALVHQMTNSLVWSVAAMVCATVITLKLADWSASSVKNFSGLSGVSISTLSALTYYPLGVLGERIFSKIPIVDKIEADPEGIRQRLGIFGEPLVIGFALGSLLGIGAHYAIKDVLNLAFSIAAVIYLLPIMSGILGKGLMPVSDGIKDMVSRVFPNIGTSYIGLDSAILIGNTSVVVTALLLMPIALVLAFLLPGIQFIPLGDLPNMVGAIVMILVVTRGNVLKSFLIGLPILVAKLYIASQMAGIYTQLSRNTGVVYSEYQGLITSFLDGGNILRYYLVQIFSGNLWAILAIPILFGVLILARRSQQSATSASLDASET